MMMRCAKKMRILLTGRCKIWRCLDAGLPKPEYHPDNVDFKVIIWRDPARLGPVGAQSGPSQGAVRAQSGRSQGAVRAQSPREKCLILLRIRIEKAGTRVWKRMFRKRLFPKRGLSGIM